MDQMDLNQRQPQPLKLNLRLIDQGGPASPNLCLPGASPVACEWIWSLLPQEVLTHDLLSGRGRPLRL